jgi:hypothetical protein
MENSSTIVHFNTVEPFVIVSPDIVSPDIVSPDPIDMDTDTATATATIDYPDNINITIRGLLSKDDLLQTYFNDIKFYDDTPFDNNVYYESVCCVGSYNTGFFHTTVENDKWKIEFTKPLIYILATEDINLFPNDETNIIKLICLDIIENYNKICNHKNTLFSLSTSFIDKITRAIDDGESKFLDFYTFISDPKNKFHTIDLTFNTVNFSIIIIFEIETGNDENPIFYYVYRINYIYV